MESPESSESSCVSIKSIKSDQSIDPPLTFKDAHCPLEKNIHKESPESSESSCVSIKSDQSIDPPLTFKDTHCSPEMKVDQKRSKVSVDQSAQPHQTDLDSIFALLEENVITFVKTELKKFKGVLSPDDPKCVEKNSEDVDPIDNVEEEHRRRNGEAFLKITLNFLRRVKLDELANSLQSSKRLCASFKFIETVNYISKITLYVCAVC
uniref:uncharacterized protein LOC124068466 isoform X2 n=1 Tax=Scatophagus argus TaxID=75038 RepID=UPI001ED801B6|nr:uncharacterized protein LOC124068466 isoform X2 [Scatophagus argus]